MTEYIETEHDGEPARLYPDGSLRDDKGYWLTKPPGAADDITSDTAVAMVDRKVAKRRQIRDDYEVEAQRALVSELARGKSPAVAGGVLVRNVARELAAQGAAKEHGLKNYTGASDWALKQAGLIKEKVTDNRQVNIENINLDADVKDHVERLLSRLLSRAGEGD